MFFVVNIMFRNLFHFYTDMQPINESIQITIQQKVYQKMNQTKQIGMSTDLLGESKKHLSRYQKNTRFQLYKKFVNCRIKDCHIKIKKQDRKEMFKRLDIVETKNYRIPFDKACQAILQIMIVHRSSLPDAIQIFFGTKSQREQKVTMLVHKSYAKHLYSSQSCLKGDKIRIQGQKKYGWNNDQEFINLSLLKGKQMVQKVYQVFCSDMKSRDQISRAVGNFLIKEGQSKLNHQQQQCAKRVSQIILKHFGKINLDEKEMMEKKDEGEVSTGDFDKQLKEILAQQESANRNKLGIMEFQVDSDMGSICDAIKNDFNRAKQRLEFDQHLFSFDQMEVYDYPIFLN